MCPQNEKEEALTTSVWIEMVPQLTECLHELVQSETTVFLCAAMVRLQAQVGPAAPGSSVWKHHLESSRPLTEHLAARRHTGEQVSSETQSGSSVKITGAGLFIHSLDDAECSRTQRVHHLQLLVRFRVHFKTITQHQNILVICWLFLKPKQRHDAFLIVCFS